MKEKLERAMIALQNGDTNSLATIYDLTSKGVFTFVLPIVRDYATAEDIMQQTYISVYEKIASYQSGTNARNWILTIAKNLAINEFNKQKKIVGFDYDEEQSLPEGLYSLDETLDTPTIRIANEILTEEEFKIVIMFAIGEYKHREIAELLGLPLGTVTWKYKNAIEKIKNEIERRERNAEKKLNERT